MTRNLTELAARLRALHAGPAPLILPNAWDVGSALAIERAGANAIATSSGAVAGARGYPDGEVMPAAEVFAFLAGVTAAVSVPVTADLETGFGQPAGELVTQLLEAGAVGLNLEDTDRRTGGKTILPLDKQAERIASVTTAARDAGVPIVINARIDSFLRGSGDPEDRLTDAVDRARAYLAAGADCVYPIFLAEAEAIRRFVLAFDAPVNILLRSGSPPIEELARLGVRRISVGSGLWSVAMGRVERVATDLVTGDGSAFGGVREG